jgi:3-oxoacyl-[acyl-carrier protein] reductase
MILLTGSTGGIGSLIAENLSKFDKVIALYNNTSPKHKIDNITYVQVDISKEDQLDSFVGNYIKGSNNLTVIQLAAIKVDGLALSYSNYDWDRTIQTNLTSNFLLIKKILPMMIESKYGRIVFASSKGAINGDIGSLSYSATKSAIIGMSNVLAKEYARFNITSNVLMLGAFETGMYLNLSEKKKKKILELIPSKKLGSVDNIVNAIEFLMKSDYVNGSIINIDGASY